MEKMSKKEQGAFRRGVLVGEFVATTRHSVAGALASLENMGEKIEMLQASNRGLGKIVNALEQK